MFDDAFRLFSKGNVNPAVIIHLFKNLSIQREQNCIPDVVLYEGVKKIVDRLGRIEDIGKCTFGIFAVCHKLNVTTRLT